MLVSRIKDLLHKNNLEKDGINNSQKLNYILISRSQMIKLKILRILI